VTDLSSQATTQGQSLRTGAAVGAALCGSACSHENLSPSATAGGVSLGQGRNGQAEAAR
jgi:hypothetical protein